MPGTAKELLTIPQAAKVLADKYGIVASLATIRRRVDSLGIAAVYGRYRLLSKKDIPALAKELKSEGYAARLNATH